jgi:AcrR family transcriptional regulator
MARTLDPVARAVRRDAIVDVAERLIRTSGYEQMSVQAVQDELGVSRGAIYHYFDSKSALLEAVVERMTDAVMSAVEPISDDPELSAPAKLQAVFRAGGQWKSRRRELMLALVSAWFSSDNAIVRERLWAIANARLVPLLAAIVRQGKDEGSITATHPDHAAAILVGLLEASGNEISRMFVAGLDGRVSMEEVAAAAAAYNEAVERILGITPGSFQIVDQPTLDFWFS